MIKMTQYPADSQAIICTINQEVIAAMIWKQMVKTIQATNRRWIIWRFLMISFFPIIKKEAFHRLSQSYSFFSISARNFLPTSS